MRNHSRRRANEDRKLAVLLRSLGVAVILEEQGGVCIWCREVLDPCGAVEVDHHIPVSKGGPTLLHNLRVLCRPCNQRKGTLMPDEFANLMGHDLL